ncbi:hypothetical protein RFI_28693, partial [Reticulomyxa filosa]
HAKKKKNGNGKKKKKKWYNKDLKWDVRYTLYEERDKKDSSIKKIEMTEHEGRYTLILSNTKEVKSPRLYFPDDNLWLNFGKEKKSDKKEPEEKKRVIDSKTNKCMKAYEQSGGGNIWVLHNDLNALEHWRRRKPMIGISSEIVIEALQTSGPKDECMSEMEWKWDNNEQRRRRDQLAGLGQRLC